MSSNSLREDVADKPQESEGFDSTNKFASSRRRLSSPPLFENEEARFRHNASPVVNVKGLISTESPLPIPVPPEFPIEFRTGLKRNSQVSPSSRRNRLILFGSLILVLAALLWFSVYQRHNIWSPLHGNRSPWIILGIVVTFLGTAACCAGAAVKKEEDSQAVRVVRGDSILGMVAESAENHGEDDYIEPTTPQRIWAMKAISELDRL